MKPLSFLSPWCVWLPALCLMCGCETANTTPPPQATVQAPVLPPPPAEPAAPPSALSYGMVTGKVQKNGTTQTEIIELFGGPSTLTTDKDGTEVWMYDKTTSTTSGNYAQSSAQNSAQAEKSSASALAAFLGLPMFGGIGGVGGSASSSNSQSAQQSAQVGQGQSTVTRSVKTITFIIKFNQDKTVKDYAVRQSNY